MKTWVRMTGGLIVWALHFLGVYGLASLAEVSGDADHPAWRWGALAFSAICLLACLGLLGAALHDAGRRRPAPPGFADQIAAAGAALGGIAVLWQALPLALV